MKIAVYVFCSILGYLAGYFLPIAWFPYDSILISYHLFLGWLVIDADHKTGLSLPIFSTILTHLACITVVVFLGVGRHYIPFFWLVRYLIPALAPFEVTWLFGGGREKKAVSVTEAADAAARASAAAAATGEDYEEWLRYLAQRSPSSRKPGTTLKDEYEHWLVARAKSRTAALSGNKPA